MINMSIIIVNDRFIQKENEAPERDVDYKHTVRNSECSPDEDAGVEEEHAQFDKRIREFLQEDYNTVDL